MKRVPARWWRKPWATPPMGMVAPARPSPTRNAGWWPKRRARPDRKHFPKNDFHLDLAAGSCTCPAGQVTRAIVPAGKRTDGAGRTYRLQAFQFDGAVCWVCPLRSQCIAAQGRQGRRVLIHPQEALLQQGPGLAAKRRLRRVSSATGGSGAQIGPAGPAGHPPVPLLR